MINEMMSEIEQDIKTITDNKIHATNEFVRGELHANKKFYLKLQSIKAELNKIYSKYREMGYFDYEQLAPDICDDLRELIGDE